MPPFLSALGRIFTDSPSSSAGTYGIAAVIAAAATGVATIITAVVKLIVVLRPDEKPRPRKRRTRAQLLKELEELDALEEDP